MKLRRFLSCMMALLLVCGLPLAAFADTYDIAEGSIEISASGDKQTVTQDGNTVDDDAPVITGTTTENTVTIHADAGAEAYVTLSDVNIDVRETGDYQHKVPGEAAVQITGEGDVTIELDGENTVQSGFYRAGVEKNDADSSGSLTITDENGTDGSLKATGGVYGSGIGGGNDGSGSDITITGSAEVTANGGMDAAGIGGGAGGGAGGSGSGSNITITGNAEVTAQGNAGGAGIGGGAFGSGSNITISGSAEVTAKGDETGAGIGGGFNSNGNGTGSNITVSEDAQVKAQGGDGYYNKYSTFGTGAAIGDGGGEISDYNPEAVKGKDAVVTTDAPQGGDSYGLYVGELNEGWVATYAPGENMGTEKPGSLTYQDASGAVTTEDDSSNIGLEAALPATADAHGHEAGFKVGNKVVAVTTHNYGDYVSNPDATCTHDGTKTAMCTVPGCTKTHTIPDPAKGHSFTDYVSDGNATYTEDGTKTAKCDHCDATDTLPDPGSRLPFYQVNGKDGARLPCREVTQDGVLTITVEADFATLTGSFSGIQALKGQGIDTIVFVTNGATSTFALSDLLAQGSLGERFCLTHDASAVTFTLGQATDLSNILK